MKSANSLLVTLTAFLLALVAMVQATPAWFGLSSPDKGDIKFIGLPYFDKWYSGEQVTFQIKLEHERHVQDFLAPGVKVVLERSRLGPNKVFEMLETEIVQVEGRLLQVSGTVLQVDKKAGYKVKIRAPGALYGEKSLAKSNYNILKFWRYTAPRTVTVDPKSKPADPLQEP